MSTFDEILKEKLRVPVPVTGKEGKKISPEEAMVNALLNNAMKGDIASISFIRNMTKVTDPEMEMEYQKAHIAIVTRIAKELQEQLIEENAWDGQALEVAMLAETAALVDKLSQQMASPDFQEVITDPRTGKQTVSPLIQLRDSQRELFDRQLTKIPTEAINRKIVRNNLK